MARRGGFVKRGGAKFAKKIQNFGEIVECADNAGEIFGKVRRELCHEIMRKNTVAESTYADAERRGIKPVAE